MCRTPIKGQVRNYDLEQSIQDIQQSNAEKQKQDEKIAIELAALKQSIVFLSEREAVLQQSVHVLSIRAAYPEQKKEVDAKNKEVEAKNEKVEVKNSKTERPITIVIPCPDNFPCGEIAPSSSRHTYSHPKDTQMAKSINQLLQVERKENALRFVCDKLNHDKLNHVSDILAAIPTNSDTKLDDQSDDVFKFATEKSSILCMAHCYTCTYIHVSRRQSYHCCGCKADRYAVWGPIQRQHVLVNVCGLCGFKNFGSVGDSFREMCYKCQVKLNVQNIQPY